MGEALSRTQLAAALGVSPSSVDRLIAAGLTPTGRRGPAKLYDVRVARAAVRNRRSASARSVAPELAAAQRARVDAQARRVRRLIAELEHQHVTREAVLRFWTEKRAIVAEQLHRLEDDLVRQILASLPAGRADVERILRLGIYAALASLSTPPATTGKTTAGSPRRAPALRASKTLLAARERHTRLQAQHLDLREQIAAGDLLALAPLEQQAYRSLSAFRAKLLAIPHALSDRLPQIAQREGGPGIRAALGGLFDDAIAELDLFTDRVTRQKDAIP